MCRRDSEITMNTIAENSVSCHDTRFIVLRHCNDNICRHMSCTWGLDLDSSPASPSL